MMRTTNSAKTPLLVRSSAALLTTLIVSGCVTAPQVGGKQVSSVAVPETLIPGEKARPMEDRWWESFQDPILDALVEEALNANRDLRVAQARVREARAEVGVVEAALYPTLSAALAAGRSRTQQTPLGNAGSVGGTASWEADLFGERRAEVRGARHAALGTLEDTKAVYLLVASEAVRSYFEVAGLQRRVELAQQAIELQRRILDLTQGRYEAGLSGAFDVQRAQTALDVVEAQLLQTRDVLMAARNTQAVLLGRTPDKIVEPAPWKTASLPELPGQVPGEALLQRPDVSAAQARWQAQAERVAAARTQRYPKFVFSFDAARWRIDPTAAPAFNVNVFGAQLGITIPLLDGGRIHSQIAANEARLDGAAAQYEAVLLSAIAEVDTAYQRLRLLTERRQYLLAARDNSSKAAQSARALYEAGAIELLPVLTAQSQAIQQEDALAQAETSSPIAYAGLMRALGGGKLLAQERVAER